MAPGMSIPAQLQRRELDTRGGMRIVIPLMRKKKNMPDTEKVQGGNILSARSVKREESPGRHHRQRGRFGGCNAVNAIVRVKQASKSWISKSSQGRRKKRQFRWPARYRAQQGNNHVARDNISVRKQNEPNLSSIDIGIPDHFSISISSVLISI